MRNVHRALRTVRAELNWTIKKSFLIMSFGRFRFPPHTRPLAEPGRSLPSRILGAFKFLSTTLKPVRTASAEHGARDSLRNGCRVKLAKEPVTVGLLDQSQVGLSQLLRADRTGIQQGTPADHHL